MPAVSSHRECESHWHLVQERCFRVFSSSSSYPTANQRCRNYVGGYLAMLKNDVIFVSINIIMVLKYFVVFMYLFPEFMQLRTLFNPFSYGNRVDPVQSLWRFQNLVCNGLTLWRITNKWLNFDVYVV